jgi:CubicO group peptidase (beta-lactamase class C family)
VISEPDDTILPDRKGENMKIWSLVLLIFSLHISSVFADQVDDYVNSEMKARKIPGLSIAVMKNGQIVKSMGYGYSNLEHTVPAKPETVYQSGSVGKQFTATGIMMLVEEGKIALDDPITKYFPDAPESWKQVKVRNLLSHTGGISNKIYDEINMREDYTEDQMLKKIESMPLDFKPGDNWNYSNSGYVLLGILIHKVTGKFYGDVLQERIFKPLGMTTTRIISEADIIPNRAAGYEFKKGVLKNQDWVAPMINTTADGSLYFTVLDLSKWDGALYGEKMLKKSSLDQMWTPFVLNNGRTVQYGFAWRFDEVRKHRIVEHGGSWQGFNTHIARYVDDKLTVVVLANLSGARPETIAHQIAAFYNPDLAPIQKKEAKINAALLDQYAGEYQFPESKMVLVHKEGHLKGGSSEEGNVDLIPESETSFFTKDGSVVTFVKDASGKVTHMIYDDTEGKKIK